MRVSRLMQRLAIEDSREADATHPEPHRRVIEYAYVRPRSNSRGRTTSRQRSPPASRSPARRVIEYAHVRPRSTSRGRTTSRRRSPPGSRSPARRRDSPQPLYHKQSHGLDAENSPWRYRHQNRSQDALNWRRVDHGVVTGSAQHPPSRSRQNSTDSGRLSSNNGDLTFGGRVRHVRASDRLG